jgi:hypothetical protein
MNTTGDDGDQQRWIDELLRSSAAAELEAAPAGVKFATAAAIGKQRQRRRRTLAVFAAAATVGVIWAWPSSSPLPQREEPGEELSSPLVAQSQREPPAVGNPSLSPSLQRRGMLNATFVNSSDAIAVPLKSPSDDVTVVQVYPTINAQRSLRHTSTLSSISPIPNGG